MMLSELIKKATGQLEADGDMLVVVTSSDTASGYESAGWTDTVEHDGENCFLLD
jgi:hypothetical protein